MKVCAKVNENVKVNFIFVLVVISIFTLPFVNVLHFALPLGNTFGKSTWLVVPVFVLITAYFERILTRNFSLNSLDLTLVFMVVFVGIIFTVRYIVYDEVQSFLNYRFLATSLVYLAIASQIVKNKLMLRVIALTIVATGLAVAVVQAINFNFFPNVMLFTDNAGVIRLIFVGEQTRSMLLGASISGNQIVCSMFVLVALVKSNFIRMNLWVSWILLLFMVYAVSLGESRYPIAIAISLLVFNFFYHKLQHTKIVLVAVSVLLLTSYVFSNFENWHISRINEDSGGRIEKTILGFKILSDSVTNFSIGTSNFQAGNAAEQGYVLSDNSYFEVATSFGVPFAVIFFTLWFNFISRYIVNILSLFFLGYLVVGLSLTNCILWESWLCLAMFSIAVVGSIRHSSCQVQHT